MSHLPGNKPPGTGGYPGGASTHTRHLQSVAAGGFDSTCQYLSSSSRGEGEEGWSRQTDKPLNQRKRGGLLRGKQPTPTRVHLTPGPLLSPLSVGHHWVQSITLQWARVSIQRSGGNRLLLVCFVTSLQHASVARGQTR